MRTIVCIIGLSLFIFFIIPIQTKAQSIEGCVTNGITGDPLENAAINCGPYMIFTGPDGYYGLFLVPGTYNLTCMYGDLCPFDTTITIMMGQNIELDIQLFPCPEITVEPLNIEVTLEPGSQITEIITITNPGDLEIEWNAELEIMTSDNADDFLDVQFQYPLTGPNSYAGIECDGEYFYTTDPFSGVISKYNLDGTYIENLTIVVNGLRDLAFDGTYFYGGNGSSTIFQMDFYSQVVVSTFSVSQNVRAIAYDHDEGVFYGYNWGGDIIVFDQSGATLGSVPVGSSGANYAGFAYDNVSDGSPYLWGYGLVGTDPNTIVQMELPGLQETGFTVSLGSLLPEPFVNGAGGLFSHPGIFPGTWTLGGMIMDEWMWGLELAEYQNWDWISIEPVSGILEPGESEEMDVFLDATDVYNSVNDAEIHFITTPNAGSPNVEITMVIEGFYFIGIFYAELNCTNVILEWKVFPPGVPADSFHVFRDYTLIATTMEEIYIDSLVYPETEYNYFVTGFFMNGNYLTTSSNILISVPFPYSLEPTNLSYMVNDSLILLNWDPPTGCLTPDAYNIYRDGNLIGTSTEPNFILNIGSYSFFVTAMYYFGESGPSNSITITGINKTALNQIQLFPNPANDVLFIQSPLEINYLELLNIQGSILFSENVRSKDLKLDISNLKPGVYFLELKTAVEIISRKVMVK